MSPTRKAFIIGFSLFLSFFANIAFDLACGPEPDPFDYYVSFFHNTINKNNDYWSFYFNGYTFLNDSEEQVSEQNINVREWAAYIGKPIKQQRIHHILYGLNRQTDSSYFWNYNPKRRLPDSLQRDPFIQALQNRPAAMTYLAAVKRTEPLVTISYDDRWNAKPFDHQSLQKIAKRYFKRATTEVDPFLKLRNFYQAQRLYHYAGLSKEALAVYDQHIQKTNSKSHVRYWALSLKAGELLHLGQKPQSAFLFSKLFAECPERRVQAYHDFSSIHAPVEQVIKQAQTPAEKAYIYAITGFHNPHIGLTALQKVYQADPSSDLISVLLVREINKIEEGYLTPRLNGSKYYGSIGYYEHSSYDSVKKSFINYIPKLQAFCELMATEKKYPQSALSHLASAYLSWIKEDAQGGLQQLDAVSNLPLNPKLEDQRQLIKLLLIAQGIKKMDRQAETNLLPSLQWLGKKVRQERRVKVDTLKFWGDYDLRYYSASSRDFYEKVLAPIYFKQKDTAMATLCILKAAKTVPALHHWQNAYGLGFDMPYFWQTEMHSYHFRQIMRWKNDSAQTTYLRLMTRDIRPATVLQIQELLGTAYLREHQYRKAAEALSHIDAAKLNKAASVADDSIPLYADPFTDQLKDFPRKYSPVKPAIHNKYLFAKAMAALQRKTLTDPKHTDRYTYAIATGLYNTSYYGNAWYYTAYHRASDDRTQTSNFYYDRDYLKAYGAEQYFLKARKLSHDPEFQARCTYMAAKCRQKRMAFPAYPEYIADSKAFERKQNSFEQLENKYNKQLKRSPYFAELKQRYGKTRFYRTAVEECSYLRDFISGK